MRFDLIEQWCLEARSIPSPSAGFGLPDATLAVLRRIIDVQPGSRVFEFGSGRSTKLFLDCGCDVTSLEESARWLRQATAACAAAATDRRHAILQTLATRVDGLAVCRGWRLGASARRALALADLVLIDAPVFAPFREQALLDALRLAPQALIVLDDARDPEVREFCVRIAARNGLPSLVSELDHGLFFTTAAGRDPAAIRARRGPTATLRTWRRLARFAGYVLFPATRLDTRDSADTPDEESG